MSFFDQRPIRLPNGIWILENSSHVSEWVRESGRLDHDQWLIPKIFALIKPGDWVLDVGAAIGDHTVSYLDAVGHRGMVVAIEPNFRAFTCLVLNTLRFRRVLPICAAVGDRHGFAVLDVGENAGAAHVSPKKHDVSQTAIPMIMVDDIPFQRLDLIKVDVEGSEIALFKGAYKTIEKFRPIIVCEINRSQLAAQGHTSEDLVRTIQSIGYRIEPVNPAIEDLMEQPQFDVICYPE